MQTAFTGMFEQKDTFMSSSLVQQSCCKIVFLPLSRFNCLHFFLVRPEEFLLYLVSFSIQTPSMKRLKLQNLTY